MAKQLASMTLFSWQNCTAGYVTAVQKIAIQLRSRLFNCRKLE
jgi:hypothetical protein